MKFFPLVALFAMASLAFADGLCVQLCVDCSQNPENATCSKVDQVCGNCPAILDSLRQDFLAAAARADSIEQERVRKDSLQSEDIRKLAELMQKNCKSDTCVFGVTINGGQLGHIRSKKRNKTTVKTAPESTSQESLLPPMSEECQNFCGLCKSENQDETSSTCEKVESQCKCSAYVEQESMLAEKAVADSIERVNKFLNQMQAVQVSAKSVFEFCEREVHAESCLVSVKILGEQMSVIEIVDISKESEKESRSVDAVAEKKVAPVDTAPVANARQDIQEKTLGQHKKDFYVGISLALDMFNETEVANYGVVTENAFISADDGLATNHTGVNLGFLVRWYLYQWCVFQTGLNVIYHHADYDIDEEDLYSDVLGRYGYGEGAIDYHSIMVEVPLQFRFGVPVDASEIFRPFVSLSTHVRKPIYAWIDHYFADWTWRIEEQSAYYFSSYVHGTDTSFETDGAYASSDMEFMEYLGFGIEISRHFSIQWQLLLTSIRTNVDEVFAYENGIDTWRLNIDFAW